MTTDTDPSLSRPRVWRPRALALVLHGGQEQGRLPTTPVYPPYLRMLPFARDLEVRSRGRVGAAVLRNRVRGWNGDERSPVPDGVWALQKLRASYPDLPIGVIGHSMGGRVCLELADRPEVSSIAALAPWIGERYDAQRFLGTPLLVAHGQRDLVTGPDVSRDLVDRIRAAGGEATYCEMAGGHSMLWKAGRWHRLASQFTVSALLG